MKKRIDRTGEIGYNNYGTKMVITKCVSAKEIYVEFQDEYKFIAKTQYDNFKIGNVKNPYDKTVHNIGYIGVGKYTSKINKEYTKEYRTWQGMLERCYDKIYQNKYPTYIGCIVCEEWHNFQNFAKWYEENYYEIEGQKMCLDKDILFKGNKIYSPQTCMFVPNRINVLFIKSEKARGKYPIGVGESGKIRNPFRAYCSVCDENGKHYIALGNHNTIEKAFTCYKNFKEKYIKQVADEYKDYIPTELYEAMYRYEVEIDD